MTIGCIGPQPNSRNLIPSVSPLKNSGLFTRITSCRQQECCCPRTGWQYGCSVPIHSFQMSFCRRVAGWPLHHGDCLPCHGICRPVRYGCRAQGNDYRTTLRSELLLFQTQQNTVGFPWCHVNIENEHSRHVTPARMTNTNIQGCIKKFPDWTYRLECIYLI
jgi:hypothetical protein